jgi:pyruvate,orthophosphate dikinase
MDSGIHFFSHIDVINKKIDRERLGIRGRQANEFAELGFPILPGIILDTDIACDIRPAEIKKDITVLLNKCAGIVGKKYGDPENPMLLKVVISSNMAMTGYPALHNFGLVRNTVDGFAGRVGEDFAAHELLFLIRGMLRIKERTKELEGGNREKSEISAKLKILDRALDRMPNIDGPSNERGAKEKRNLIDRDAEVCMKEYAHFFQPGFFDDVEKQLLLSLVDISNMLRMDDHNDTAIVISPMVYGNYGKDSCYGTFFSRDTITGEKKLEGKFFRGKFNEVGAEGRDIAKIGDEHLKELQKIAWTLEDRFKEIRQVFFTIENGRLWLIKQSQVDRKSARADIKLLLDLAKRRIVNNAYVVNAVDPLRLAELIHPVVDPASVRNMKFYRGGIAGAPGAAIGRVYFSTDSLLEARKLARKKGQDTRTILVAVSSFAEDVKAIEVSAGVLTAEGGYSAHASVVARQYGKVSLVAPDLRIKGKKAALGNLSFSEGDYITLDVPFYAPSYGTSSVYFGSASLTETDPRDSGLLDFIDLSKGFLKNFHVRCNADSPRDAALGLSFGADGVGLCRTEHMFFGAERIQVFRGMLLSTNAKEREKALAKLALMQREDFCGIFRVMAGKEVTIRLLDSPLHEFMPRSDEELAAYLAYSRKAGKASSGGGPSKAEVLARIDALHEFNPMLGHRGCRLAVSHPEIYAMQIKAIFEAAWKMRKEGIEVRLEIMVPIVMNASELKLIAYGKKIEGANYKGIVDIEEEFRSELRSERNSELRAALKAKKVDYKIGAMIELPAAALGAAEIARYAGFFSFGTNDLTQSTLGISRDDFTSFMADYTLFDLIRGNPFSELDPRVRELIALAAARGRLTRPDLTLGLCGEHGANPANVRFCMEAGLDYVSCSPYSVPIAILAAAQVELENDLP